MDTVAEGNDTAKIALFAALIAVLGFIPAIPLPLAPITAQSLGLMLAGLCLSPRNAFLAALLFVGAMLLGLPILSGGRGGYAMLFTPSVGFIVGFPFAAGASAILMQRLKHSPLWLAALLSSIGGCILVLYAFGIAGFMLNKHLGFQKSLGIMGVYIPGDLIKAALSVAIVLQINKALPSAIYSRN